ncbi:MAG: hypothetical protein HGA96_03555 [Desulfobulbaceae bacterium]|nr:hypothetical protein [Desulfobulbaceae bacterium]
MQRPFDDGLSAIELALLLAASEEMAEEEPERIMLEQQEGEDDLSLDDE